MDKKFYQCRVCGDIHWGVNAPGICPTCQQVNAYEEAEKEKVNGLLANLAGKKLWRCIICNDLHIGKNAPEKCPTCLQINVYVEISEKELRTILEI